MRCHGLKQPFCSLSVCKNLLNLLQRLKVDLLETSRLSEILASGELWLVPMVPEARGWVDAGRVES